MCLLVCFSNICYGYFYTSTGQTLFNRQLVKHYSFVPCEGVSGTD